MAESSISQQAKRLRTTSAAAPSSAPSAPSAGMRPPEPAMGPSRSQKLQDLLGKAAKPSENILAYSMIMFARVPKDNQEPYPTPECKDLVGAYCKIGTLNNKPIYKAQELGSTDVAWSPMKCSYLWFSEHWDHYFLSDSPVDEEATPKDQVNWDSVGAHGMFSSDLKTGFLPWDNPNGAQDIVKWHSFWSWSKAMLEYTGQKLSGLLAVNPGLELSDVEGGETPALFPSGDPAPVLPAFSKAAPPVAPSTIQVGGWTINAPPPPVLPPIRKSGYFSKLVAFMVAEELGLQERLAQTKAHILRVDLFQRFYASHKAMMERTGEDDRFHYT